MRKSTVLGTNKLNVSNIKNFLKKETLSGNKFSFKEGGNVSIRSTMRRDSTAQGAIRKTLINNKSQVTTENFNESFDKMMGDKVMLKDMIENANIDTKVLNLIDETLELFNMEENGNAKQERERYELIEKENLESIKKANEQLKTEKVKLTETFNELVGKFNRTTGELNYLSQSYHHLEKLKDNNINQIYTLEENVKEVAISNQKLRDMMRKEKTEKDNILRALVTFSRKYDTALPDGLKEICDSFNDEFYTKTADFSQMDKVEVLKVKLEKCEKELLMKKEERQKLKMMVYGNQN